jgi:hypothetical protein
VNGHAAQQAPKPTKPKQTAAAAPAPVTVDIKKKDGKSSFGVELPAGLARVWDACSKEDNVKHGWVKRIVFERLLQVSSRKVLKVRHPTRACPHLLFSSPTCAAESHRMHPTESHRMHPTATALMPPWGWRESTRIQPNPRPEGRSIHSQRGDGGRCQVVGGGVVLDLIEEWSLGANSDLVRYAPLLTALAELFFQSGGTNARAFPAPCAPTPSPGETFSFSQST